MVFSISGERVSVIPCEEQWTTCPGPGHPKVLNSNRCKAGLVRGRGKRTRWAGKEGLFNVIRPAGMFYLAMMPGNP